MYIYAFGVLCMYVHMCVSTHAHVHVLDKDEEDIGDQHCRQRSKRYRDEGCY